MQNARTQLAFLICFALVWSLGAVAQQTPKTHVDAKVPSPVVGSALGNDAPEFTLSSVTGETTSLSQYRGQVVLLNFWASWCSPCKIMMPWLAELQSEDGPQGLQVIGITEDDDATRVDVGEVADNLGVNYPILIGNEKVEKAYGGLPALPTTFLIGRDGKIVDVIIGIKQKNELKTAVRKALHPNTEPEPLKPTKSAAQN